MSTQIRATTLVDVPFSALAEHLASALCERRTLVVSPMWGFGERVRVEWSMVDDPSDRARRHDALAFEWTPDHPQLFPAFRGLISVRPHFRRSWMRIAGAYDPPLAAAGRAYDRLFGRVVAWLTLRRIARALRRDVELRYRVHLQQIGAAGPDGHSGGERDEVARPH
ncbi:MAG: hypothetical protein KGN02_10650 [bacterium]|nr:hypothetical protein [bacterium]